MDDQRSSTLYDEMHSPTWMEKTNLKVAKSWVGRHFLLEFSGAKKERKGTRFFTEIRAGLATYVEAHPG